MVDIEISDDIETKLKKYVSKAKNLDVLILKGHLIIEISINKAIELLSGSPDAYEKMNLTFAKKIPLLQILMGNGVDDLASAINKLNSLRNQMGHNLDYDMQMADDFIKSTFPDLVGQKFSSTSRISYLKQAVSFVSGQILGMSSAMKEVKDRK